MKIHLSFYLYLISLFFTGTAISRPCFNFFHCLAAKLIKGIIHKLIHEMSSESIKPVKFMFSKKAIKIDEVLTVDLKLLYNVKWMVKISSIFVAFLENINFRRRKREALVCC